MSYGVGFVGLGKLGLPVAAALGSHGQHVVGYDANPSLAGKRRYEHRELGPDLKDDFQTYFDRAELSFAPTVAELVRECHLIFLAVQTPHAPEYEGVTRLPTTRADFDYTHLSAAAEEIALHSRPDQILVVISTVLPGTLRRRVLPLTRGRVRVVYNPFFVAMGTVMKDFLNPEFVLLGGDDRESLWEVGHFYNEFYLRVRGTCGRTSPVPVRAMSVESAELTKVAYNTYISTKIAVANALMEVAHHVPGCHVDDVTDALKCATERVVSPRYMSAGMGDGGGCHPRDNIAMSWLAGELNLSSDLFGAIMEAREDQTDWLAEIVQKEARRTRLPVLVIGKAYKPETNLTSGSPALLLSRLLEERGVAHDHYDPFVDRGASFAYDRPRLFFVATRHECFRDHPFPAGSVVIDPFRYVTDRPGVRVVRVGVGV